MKIGQTHAGILLEDIVARRKVPFWAVALGWVRRNPTGALGLTLIFLLMLMAVGAEILSTHDPIDLNSPINLGPSAEHYLGTDAIGRDIYTHLLFGSRVALSVGLGSVLLGATAGGILGLLSAYRAGMWDLLGQRLIDTLDAFPRIILALTLMAILGPSVVNVVITLAVSLLPLSTRVTRSVVLREKAKVYIDAARAIGAPGWRIMLRHILPNSVAPYLVLVSVEVGSTIVAEASLSFLGAGVPPDTPSWGSMLAIAASSYFDTTPALALAPGLAITAAVLGFNMFGDAIRDTLDPKLRRG